MSEPVPAPSACEYCAERLRVNVGLMTEVRQLKDRLKTITGGHKITVGDARDWKARAEVAEAKLAQVEEALRP